MSLDGYTLGNEGSGESERMEVCPHGSPIGWACVGCAHDLVPPKYGTVGARRADPPRFVLRAVCNHCGVRSWRDPQTGEHVR